MAAFLAVSGTLVALVAPGYGLLAWRARSMSNDLFTAMVCALSILTFGIAMGLAYVMGWSPVVVSRGFLLLSAAGAIFAAFRSTAPRLDFSLLAPAALAMAQAFCLQVSARVYCGGGWYGDWALHYETTMVLLGGRPADTPLFGGLYTLASRPPLFNLWQAGVLAVARSAAWPLYQAACAALAAPFLMASLVLARRVLPQPLARWSWCAILLSPMAMKNIAYPWPKLLAASYVLLALAYVLDSRPRGALAGLLCGAGMLAHPLALPYALLIGVRIGRGEGARALAWWTLVALAVALPWQFWVATAVGWDRAWRSNPVIAKSGEHAWLAAKAHNAVSSLFPVRLATSSSRSHAALVDGWLAYQYGTLPGNLGVALLIALAMGAGATGRIGWLWLWVAWGFLCGTALHPLNIEDNGIAQVTMQPAAATLVLLALAALERLPRWCSLGALVALALEHTLSFLLAAYWQHADPAYPLLRENLALAQAFRIQLAAETHPKAAFLAAAAALAIPWAAVAWVARSMGAYVLDLGGNRK